MQYGEGRRFCTPEWPGLMGGGDTSGQQSIITLVVAKLGVSLVNWPVVNFPTVANPDCLILWTDLRFCQSPDFKRSNR